MSWKRGTILATRLFVRRYDTRLPVCSTCEAGIIGIMRSISCRSRPVRAETSTMRFSPRIEILPPAQREFWLERPSIPQCFVLYGGTAIALRLGHRSSEDFDFFSSNQFETATLLA